MKFYRLRDIDLQKVELIPREDLEGDGSYIAFDVIGDIDVSGFYADKYRRFTVFKLYDGVIVLEIECKCNGLKPRAHYSTIETRGICSADEAAYMDALYYQIAGVRQGYILHANIGGERYEEISRMCH